MCTNETLKLNSICNVHKQPTFKSSKYNIDVPTCVCYNCKYLLGASTIKGISGPQVQALFKDYVFSSLNHGLHVLDGTHYWMIMPISKVYFTCVSMNLRTIYN